METRDIKALAMVLWDLVFHTKFTMFSVLIIRTLCGQSIHSELQTSLYNFETNNCLPVS